MADTKNERPYRLLRTGRYCCENGEVTPNENYEKVVTFATEAEAKAWALETYPHSRTGMLIVRAVPIKPHERLAVLREAFEEALDDAGNEDDNSTTVDDAFDALIAFARAHPEA